MQNAKLLRSCSFRSKPHSPATSSRARRSLVLMYSVRRLPQRRHHRPTPVLHDAEESQCTDDLSSPGGDEAHDHRGDGDEKQIGFEGLNSGVVARAMMRGREPMTWAFYPSCFVTRFFLSFFSFFNSCGTMLAILYSSRSQLMARSKASWDMAK